MDLVEFKEQNFESLSKEYAEKVMGVKNWETLSDATKEDYIDRFQKHFDQFCMSQATEYGVTD